MVIQAHALPKPFLLMWKGWIASGFFKKTKIAYLFSFAHSITSSWLDLKQIFPSPP
jgi:hypothetical protein